MILLTALYYYYLFLEWQISTSVAVVVQLAAQCISPVSRQVLVCPRNLGTVEDLMNVRTICNSSGCTNWDQNTDDLSNHYVSLKPPEKMAKGFFIFTTCLAERISDDFHHSAT